jgi:hypothetical protein
MIGLTMGITVVSSVAFLLQGCFGQQKADGEGSAICPFGKLMNWLLFFSLFNLIRLFALFFADTGFEIADGFTHALSYLGQFSCTEYNQDDHQYDDQFRHSQTTKHKFLLIMIPSSLNSRIVK